MRNALEFAQCAATSALLRFIIHECKVIRSTTLCILSLKMLSKIDLVLFLLLFLKNAKKNQKSAKHKKVEQVFFSLSFFFVSSEHATQQCV